MTPQKVIALMTEKGRNTLERHIQTIGVALVIMTLGWVGSAITSASEEIVRLQSEVKSLAARLGEVEDMQSRLQRLDTRVGILEDRADREDAP